MSSKTAASSITSTRPRIFVYGTLKRGFCNHRHMEAWGLEYIEDAVTAEPCVLYMDDENRCRPSLTDGWGSCVQDKVELERKKSPLGHQVRGEVYELPDTNALSGLDRFERVPSHYSRRLINLISCYTAASLEAFVYFANVSAEKWGQLETGKIRLLKEYTIMDHSRYTPREIRAGGKTLVNCQTNEDIPEECIS